MNNLKTLGRCLLGGLALLSVAGGHPWARPR